MSYRSKGNHEEESLPTPHTHADSFQAVSNYPQKVEDQTHWVSLPTNIFGQNTAYIFFSSFYGIKVRGWKEKFVNLKTKLNLAPASSEWWGSLVLKTDWIISTFTQSPLLYKLYKEFLKLNTVSVQMFISLSKKTCKTLIQVQKWINSNVCLNSTTLIHSITSPLLNSWYLSIKSTFSVHPSPFFLPSDDSFRPPFSQKEVYILFITVSTTDDRKPPTTNFSIFTLLQPYANSINPYPAQIHWKQMSLRVMHALFSDWQSYMRLKSIVEFWEARRRVKSRQNQ